MEISASGDFTAGVGDGGGCRTRAYCYSAEGKPEQPAATFKIMVVEGGTECKNYRLQVMQLLSDIPCRR